MIRPQPNARQVPVEGGSGVYPTGAIQFRNDWPGLFVRGDNAIALLVELEYMVKELQRDAPKFSGGLQVKRIMEIIENDVIYREH